MAEAVLLGAAAWASQHFELASEPTAAANHWAQIIIFSSVLSCCTLSMGVYMALVREGFGSMVLRTLVSFFLLGSLSLFLLGMLFGEELIPQSLIFWGVIFATGLVVIARFIFVKVVDTQQLKRRVVVYGAGVRAEKLLADLAPDISILGVQIVGCVASADEAIAVDPLLVIDEPQDWLAFVRQAQISEIVISPDERRRSSGSVFPLSQFLDCKLAGIESSDALSFCERELGKIDITLLQPSWMLFSDGFKYSKRRSIAKRLFDLILASAFFAVL
jgi:FlaA1/EpsC-like NDP-sugar epimerase